MGIFSRAFSAALKSSGRTPTEAARFIGVSQASISRSLSGETLPSPGTLAKLLLALAPGDRPACLLQYLLEHTPEEYRNQVNLSNSARGIEHRAMDDLSLALTFLESEATNNRHLESMLVELAKTLAGDGGGLLKIKAEVSDE